MEPFALMLWIFVVPLHAYVLQPSAKVVAVEDSGSEGMSWHESEKESVGEPMPPVGDQDSHGVGGAQQERDPKAEAGEVERERLYDADAENGADDEEGKGREEGHRGGSLDGEKKEAVQKGSDVEEEGELTPDLEEIEKEGAHRDDDKKEQVGRDDDEKDERREEENGKEGEVVGEVNRNLKEYREEMQIIPSSSPGTDSSHLSLNLDLIKETNTPHFSPNPGLSIETGIPHFSPNPGLSIETGIPHFSPNPGLSIDIEIPHLSDNHGPSIETDTPHLSPNLDLSIEMDTPHLSPNPGLSIKAEIPHLSSKPNPSIYVDWNSSVSHQSQDLLQILLPAADSTVTPTVSHRPVTAGESEEATFTPVKLNSKLVQIWNLTDSSRPRLREEEGLVPKAIQLKVDSFRYLSNKVPGTQKQNRSEKKRSKFNRPMPKPKKKKTHPAKKPEKTKSKQVKAEEKSKSLKKDKNKKNKKKKQKESKKAEKETLYFPYFKDDYCPQDCACYGRVVQCSDKGMDKIPYGIPYNARYILLMNNKISGIQLDLIREYISLEFLVLSNNLLTDGSIEGAFEGVEQLKRLYLDRNHLNSIPTDLPDSLEELRLDSNNVSVMSEVAWARCPSLQILSLNNNSLWAESVPEGVFTPLTRLRTLSLIHNRLTATPVHLPTNLKELYLRGNHIDLVSGDTFAEGSDLLVLDLSANRLTNKGLAKDSLQRLVHLENLNLEGNLLRNIPKHLPPMLRTLNLEGNAITSVSKAAFLSLPHLEHLGLSRNQITRVAPGAFWGSPALHQLELGHNVLRQVPRHLPLSLRSVSLVHNKIHSIPRDAFCTKGKDTSLSSLVRVNLEHNLIHLADLDSQAFNCLRGYQVIHFY